MNPFWLYLLSLPVVIMFFARSFNDPEDDDSSSFPILPSRESLNKIIITTIVISIMHLPLYGLWKIASKSHADTVAEAALNYEKHSFEAKNQWQASNLVALFFAIPISIGAAAESCAPFFRYFAIGICWLYISYYLMVFFGMLYLICFRIKQLASVRKFRLREFP